MDADRYGVDPQSTIRSNLEALQLRIRAACVRANRARTDVRLLPVSKTVPVDIIRLACNAGLNDFAENKVQEAHEKAQRLADLPIRWSIIGHLQTNKARHVARFASELQSLDNLRVAEELQRRLLAGQRTLEVMVQVNTSGDANQSGLAIPDVADFVAQLPAFPQLRPRGLMTIAAHTSDSDEIRSCFRSLRELRERLANPAITDLSMGMSGDFEIGIEEGATVVRVGSALFGARTARNN